MRNRINNILIGLLWLLAATLGTTFWFNTMFGFNIFSAQHWQYIAYMQATGQPVKPLFYISMVIAVLITTFVLYKLLQPRFRQITMPVIDRAPVQKTTVAEPSPTIQAQKVVEAPVQHPIPQEPIPQAQGVAENPMSTTSSAARPPRLNIPTVTRTVQVPRVPLTPQNPETEYTEIRNIFESAGYVFKGTPKIKNVQIATVAIGTNEVLWIGAVGVKNADMQRAIQTLSGVFSDTLEDIEIHINAFVISAPDAAGAPSDILQFATVEDLRNYITGNPNTPPEEDESDNFDAYSGYIGTVMDYVGKI